MPDIKTIENEIHTRLAELHGLIEPLRVEAEQLRKLTALFHGSGTPPPVVPVTEQARGRTRTTPAGAKPARLAATAPRAKRGHPPGNGDRVAQAVAQITGQPGITVTELAAAIGTAPNYLYRVLPRLQRDGRITKRGKGYHAADAAEQVSPTDG